MQDYTTQPATVPALSRTWETKTLDRMDGAVVQVRYQIVSISNRTGEYTAEIDGQPATVFQADRILRGADTRTMVSEVIPMPVSMTRLGVWA
ncbi:hypothetical protein [Deinococcus sp. QL22]|uniref:hypothetical protein n=1 Tax=Deinococcus sp. QL22 TaxID=2939437 RepID=UPI002016F58C|nr:hypothetical protein [Deinococcus sp. QL22]UQN10335.1 hypothetical protein M1R55_29735 [Deinococcus sp. QL22]UQN10469.1 hypothetical protein M1R55_29060 [Deinococcus sp. QL22]